MNNTTAAIIAHHGLASMLYEVYTTPKPGLVDAKDSGAHKDMNLETFIKSSWSLLPTLYQCALAGIKGVHQPPKATLAILRDIGIQGEKTMFRATDGVNTQKGMIFALGILNAAIGRVKASGEKVSIDAIVAIIKAMTEGIVTRELNIPKKDTDIEGRLTAGETLYRRYGVTGIRGEAEGGFSSVVHYGLPTFKRHLKEGLSFNDAAVNTLLTLMAVVEDTTVLWRTGPEGLSYMKTQAKKALALGGMNTKVGQRAIVQMNHDFIKRNISPGGCADLLAVTIMLYLTLRVRLN